MNIIDKLNELEKETNAELEVQNNQLAIIQRNIHTTKKNYESLKRELIGLDNMQKASEIALVANKDSVIIGDDVVSTGIEFNLAKGVDRFWYFVGFDKFLD